MRLLHLNTATAVMVFMTNASDHVSGKTGLTLSITASKNGGAFGAIAPTVTERGDGWYSIALLPEHTDTEGDLALHITGSGADPSDVLMNVNVLEQMLRNKRTLNPATGVETLFNDDGSALFTRNVYKDAAGTSLYDGTGNAIERVDRYA